MIHSLIELRRGADAALVIGLPMFGSSFKQVKPIPIGSLSSLLSFDLVISLGHGRACEVQSRVASSLHVFGVVILGFGILEMGLLVDGVVVVVVVEGMDLVGLATGR